MAGTTRRASRRRAKTAIDDGCRRQRHWSIQAQHAALHSRLRGHCHSFGVRGNSTSLRRRVAATKRAGYKWRRRRSHRTRLHWERCTDRRRWWPLPRPRITVRIGDGSPRATSTEEPEGGKLCAMVRTECIAPGGGQSARPMTLRRPPPLDPKGRGDKRRVGKREMSRRRVWHGPATPARSGERWIARPPRSRGGTPHPSGPRLSSDASVSHGRERCSWNAVYGGRGAVRAFTGMNGAPTSRENVPPERNTGGPPGRESHGSGVLRVPQADGGKGMTQTDGHGCRWLVDHRPGDPGGGSAGEGEQVTRCLGPGRDTRGGEPQQDSSSGMWSLESGLRAKDARVRSEGGGWKSARWSE
jgi:hypothetical protein